MVTSAKSSVPTVTDQAAAMQLGQCAKNLATCLAELRTSAQKVQILRGIEDIILKTRHAGSHCQLDTRACMLEFDTLASFQKYILPVWVI